MDKNIAIYDVMRDGMGNTYVAALDEVMDKKVICFWYNGNWAIVKENMIGDDPYIPVSLAIKIIESGDFNAADILSQLSKMKFLDNNFESISAKDMAIHMGMYEDLFSYWEMKGIKHFMLNTHMKDGPYLYKREGSHVSIIFNIGFEDNSKDENLQVKLWDNILDESYPELIKQGFEKWKTIKSREKGKISNYGFDDNITVSLTLLEDSEKYKNKNVISMINSFDENLYEEHEFDENDEYRQAPKVENSHWEINNIGKMTMYNFHTKPYDGIGYDVEDYKNAAARRFGYLIGVGYAYEIKVGDKSAMGFDFSDIMWGGKFVSFISMEMAFLAALYNEKQCFNGDNVSEAITIRDWKEVRRWIRRSS